MRYSKEKFKGQLKKASWPIVLILISSAALFSIFWLINIYSKSFPGFFPSTMSPRDAWGVLGDFVGGMLNPILGFFTIILLIRSITINQKELSLSREELELTRAELQKTTEALEDQAKTLELQRFESTFFGLLSQHNMLLERITSGQVVANVREYALESLFAKIFEAPSNKEYPIDTIEFAQNLFIKEGDSVAQYYQVLYQLLKFIFISCPSDHPRGEFSQEYLKNTTATTDEIKYVNMVRAIVPSKAICLLALSCAPSNSGDRFSKYRALLERYVFFETLSYSIENIRNKKLLNDILMQYEVKVLGKNQTTFARYLKKKSKTA